MTVVFALMAALAALLVLSVLGLVSTMAALRLTRRDDAGPRTRIDLPLGRRGRHLDDVVFGRLRWHDGRTAMSGRGH